MLFSASQLFLRYVNLWTVDIRGGGERSLCGSKLHRVGIRAMMGRTVTDQDRKWGSGVEISVNVNGSAQASDVEPRTLLVHYIRDDLGLTGTNVGCDTSSCGACTIHVDGEAVKSCTMLAVQADGAEVKTIEGMAAADGTLHPMQQSFMDNHGLQCGFCTPGMVMAATSLLDEQPSPTEADVREGLEGNLCRCTGYHNIVKSVLSCAGGAK